MRWACVKKLLQCMFEEQSSKAKALKHVSKRKPKHPCFVPPTSPYHILSLITRCSHINRAKGAKRGVLRARESTHYCHATLSWIDAEQFIKLIRGAPCSALYPRALRLRAFLLGASCFLLDVHTQAREGKEKSRKHILPPDLTAPKDHDSPGPFRLIYWD